MDLVRGSTPGDGGEAGEGGDPGEGVGVVAAHCTHRSMREGVLLVREGGREGGRKEGREKHYHTHKTIFNNNVQLK